MLHILKYIQVLLKSTQIGISIKSQKIWRDRMYIKVKRVVCTTLIENVVHLVD